MLSFFQHSCYFTAHNFEAMEISGLTRKNTHQHNSRRKEGKKNPIKDHFVLKASHTSISVFLPSFARAYSHTTWHIQVTALLPALWNRLSADSYVIVKAFFSLAPSPFALLCNSYLLLQVSPKFRMSSSPC